MNQTSEIAPVRKSIIVQASAARAFDVFTAGIDRWWPKAHGLGEAPVIESIIEPFVGGRWYTRSAPTVKMWLSATSAFGSRRSASWSVGRSAPSGSPIHAWLTPQRSRWCSSRRRRTRRGWNSNIVISSAWAHRTAQRCERASTADGLRYWSSLRKKPARQRRSEVRTHG